MNEIAALAYKCINRISRKRPSMRDVVQALTRSLKARHNKKHQVRMLLTTSVEGSADLDPSDNQTSISEHQREDSIDSLSDLPEV